VPPPPISWQEVEDALQGWLQSSAGVTAIWAEQSGTRPEYPYAALSVRAVDDWPGFAEARLDYDAARPAGSEVRIRTVKPVTVVLGVEMFSRATIGDDAAFALLNKARRALEAPATRAALVAAGFPHVDSGPVQRVPTLVQTAFEGRALMEARFGSVDGVESLLGYIASLGPVAATYTEG
jgi:hypothetical protein